jgi:CheY-like chemotaxis protein
MKGALPSDEWNRVMLDHDDLRWVAGNLTTLNRLLQQASSRLGEAREEKSGGSLQLLSEEVEQATKTSQALCDRITSRILSAASANAQPLTKRPHLTVLPPPCSAPPTPTRMPDHIPVGELAVAPAAGENFSVLNPQGRRELILVIDDDPEVLERAGAMLAEEDYRVILARDGLEAIQIYSRKGKEISLIILDFFLPVMDGDAIFDELKALNPNVQVVLSSGFAEQTKLGSMLARGLCGFIPKPYTSEKLLDQVRSIIAA